MWEKERRGEDLNMEKAHHLLRHQACGLTMTFSTLPSPPTPHPSPTSLAALPITLTINPNLTVTNSVTTAFYSPNIVNGVGKTSATTVIPWSLQ